MSNVPDYYGDNLQVNCGIYGVTITISNSDPSNLQSPPTPVVRIRLSLELFKVLAMMARRDLKTTEQALGGEIQYHFLC